MSRAPLDDHLRRHYGSQEIDPIVLKRLNRLANLENAGGGSSSRGPRRALGRGVVSRVAVTAAAVVALALLPLVLPGLWGGGTEGPESLADSILREIAHNHRNNRTVEFAAVGYAPLREQMDELDFPLRSPLRLAGGEFRMLGGRYCSIQGRPAAQIKLEDEQGRVVTLYQTSFDEQFEGLGELQRKLDGVRIRIWREGDLLFALAASEV